MVFLYVFINNIIDLDKCKITIYLKKKGYKIIAYTGMNILFEKK